MEQNGSIPMSRNGSVPVFGSEKVRNGMVPCLCSVREKRGTEWQDFGSAHLFFSPRGDRYEPFLQIPPNWWNDLVPHLQGIFTSEE
jgi:hypothetical protein